MAVSYITHGGLKISSIGLGCSRLGSIMGATKKESKYVISQAVERGITYFDTASCYGQGESERVLGSILGRNDNVCLVTKVGKVVPFRARVLRPVKAVVRTFARGSSGLGSAISKARKGELPVCFDEYYLECELGRSLKRIGVESISMAMLHSPSVDVLSVGDAVGVLEKARERGMVRSVGVSVDSQAAAEEAIKDSRISAIQIPFNNFHVGMSEWAIRAKRAGKMVVAREIFHGIQTLQASERKQFIYQNLNRSIASEGVGVTLVGTTSAAHLSDIIESAG